MNGLVVMARIALLGAAVLCGARGIALADSYDPYADGRAAMLRGDYVTTLKIWQALADKGDPAGENGMGFLYHHGYGVPQDSDKAIGWYRRAIDQGSIKAMYNLGLLHASDRWGRANPAEALRWLGEAATHGFGPADFELGEMYHDGRGVTRDKSKALAHYRRAAAHLSSAAQDAIGYMYADGEGVPQDRVAAYAWFALAAEQTGDSAQAIAQGDLEWITGQMNAAEIDAARQRVDRCRQSGFQDCP